MTQHAGCAFHDTMPLKEERRCAPIANYTFTQPKVASVTPRKRGKHWAQPVHWAVRLLLVLVIAL